MSSTYKLYMYEIYVKDQLICSRISLGSSDGARSRRMQTKMRNAQILKMDPLYICKCNINIYSK